MLGTLQCVEQKCIYQLYLCDGEVPRDPLMDIFNSLLGFAVVEVSLGNLPLDLSLLLACVRVVSLPQAGNEAWTAHTLLPHLELKGCPICTSPYSVPFFTFSFISSTRGLVLLLNTGDASRIEVEGFASFPAGSFITCMLGLSFKIFGHHGQRLPSMSKGVAEEIPAAEVVNQLMETLERCALGREHSSLSSSGI